MKKIALLIMTASACLVIAACEKDEPVDRNYSTVNSVANDVEECPRADGTPCR